MSHFCEFCQMMHTSASCYNPSRDRKKDSVLSDTPYYAYWTSFDGRLYEQMSDWDILGLTEERLEWFRLRYADGYDGSLTAEMYRGLVAERKRCEELESMNADQKHSTAEEPGELCFNEVTGLHAEEDLYRIAELEADLLTLQDRFDALKLDYLLSSNRRITVSERMTDERLAEIDVPDDGEERCSYEKLADEWFELLQALKAERIKIAELEADNLSRAESVADLYAQSIHDKHMIAELESAPVADIDAFQNKITELVERITNAYNCPRYGWIAVGDGYHRRGITLDPTGAWLKYEDVMKALGNEK